MARHNTAQHDTLRVTFATPEAVPFVKTGGLGDVAGSLPYALNKVGAHVSLVLPKYGFIPQEFRDEAEQVATFTVPLSWRNVWCGIEHLVRDGLDVYLVDNESYFLRDDAYGYFDDGERFAFFSKAVLEAMQHVEGLACDVLHCNDWQTALCPVFLRELYRDNPLYDNIRTVLTVHNVKFKGQYTDYILGDLLGLYEIPAAVNQLRMDAGSIAYLKGGLCYADALTTVSPTYAEELKTAFYGEGLEDVFCRRSDALSGVVNGIDLNEWDPKTDALIAQPFSIGEYAGKEACKQTLQEELGLNVTQDDPLVAMVGRLTSQKGLDLVTYALDELVSDGFEVAILGTGDAEYEDVLRGFEQRYPGRVRAYIAFDNALAHRMYAGADLFLMPSLFEPCGLAQMIAMRYGTLPVVRETGGLRDTVVPYNKFTGSGTGFSFANFNAHEMMAVLKTACDLFRSNRDAWRELQRQAMESDFSWTRSAERYMDIYRGLRPKVDNEPAAEIAEALAEELGEAE